MPRYPRAGNTPTTSSPPPRMAYRVDEAKYMLGIGRSKVYKMMATGALKGVKVDGVTLIIADSIEALLQGDAA